MANQRISRRQFVEENPKIAQAIVAALEEADRRVPDDIAVVGFDDIAPAALVTPMLTTIRVPQYDLGQFAAEELMSRIKQPEQTQRVVEYPLELQIRHSCGARRISSEDRRTMLRQLATAAGVGLPAKPAVLG